MGGLQRRSRTGATHQKGTKEMSWKSFLLEADPIPFVKVTMLPVPAMVFQAATSAPSDGFLVKLNQKISLPGDRADKFEKTLASLAGIPDESLRLASALSVLKDTAGIDIQGILGDYGLRSSALEREVAQFNSAIAAQRKSELDEQNAQIAAFDAQIKQLSVERLRIANMVSVAKDRLDRSQTGFDNAAEAMRTKIAQAIARLKGAA